MKKKSVGRRNKKTSKSKTRRNMLSSIAIRYLILLVSAIPSFWIFYFLFTPLTVYPVYLILKLFFPVSLLGHVLFIGEYSTPIEIVNACIAGSAYYLLLILNLSIPGIAFRKRIKMILLAFLSFLVVNILRIVILSVIYVMKPSIFDISHKLSWYLGSIILVIGIWFLEVKKFNIEPIPFYSDIKAMSKHLK